MKPLGRWSGWVAWYKEHRATVFWVGVALVALLYIVVCSLSFTRQPLGFDEGWDLQAAHNLAENGTYASFGSLYGGPDKVLDPHLSTGPTTMVPIAVAFEIFGVGVSQARVVMMLFYLATIGLIAWYAYERTKSGHAIIAPLLFLLVTRQPVNFRMDVLGEIPAAACILGSLLAWQRKKFLLAGLLAALAVLSKMIAFFLIIAGTLLLFMRLVRHWKKDRQPVLIDSVQWVIGGAIPMLFWEIFKFIQLGGSFAAYKQNWHDYAHFFINTGSGLSDNGVHLTFGERFDLFVMAFDIERLLLLLIIVAGGTLLYLRRKQLRSVVSANAYALTFMGVYSLWWFVMSNGKYTRYVVPLAVISIAVLVAMSFQEPRVVARLKKIPKRVYHGAGAVMVLVALFGVYQYYFPLQTPEYSPNLADQQRIAKRTAESHPLALTHIGWWQNPEIEFLGNLRSKDEHWRAPGSTYELILSPTQMVIEPDQYADGKTRCAEIYMQEVGYIYCKAYKPLDFKEK